MITKGVGCLLAHTMGLGKTLQIIAFLITLSLLPSDAKVDMPAHLRKDFRRYLIVCPPSIVVNWSNEFKKWTPYDCKETLGRIICVNDCTLRDRIDAIKRWYTKGGVLLSMCISRCY
jgi:SNF2-related domain